jgi:hypothetical protein
MDASGVPSLTDLIAKRTGASDSSAQAETPDVPPRLPEKRKLNWSGKSCMMFLLLDRSQFFMQLIRSRPVNNSRQLGMDIVTQLFNHLTEYRSHSDACVLISEQT